MDTQTGDYAPECYDVMRTEDGRFDRIHVRSIKPSAHDLAYERHRQAAGHVEDAFALSPLPEPQACFAFAKPYPAILGDKPDWHQGYTGSGVILSEPTPEQVDLTDIAMHISDIHRYNGAVKRSWNVAVHSYLVCYLYGFDCAREGIQPCVWTMLCLLLHDAHEAYVGDVSSPIQAALQRRIPGFKAAFKTLKHEWDVAIFGALGVNLASVDPAVEKTVRHYDLLALFLEREVFMDKAPWPWFAEEQYAPLVPNYADLFANIRSLANLNRQQSAEVWLEYVYRTSMRDEKRYSGLADKALATISQIAA